ncbi:MAG TPA: hypothetical protein VK609_08060 [Mucilaginibacter sp.]|nr:hypothetical protein [Mucilaginibacter sp.]
MLQKLISIKKIAFLCFFVCITVLGYSQTKTNFPYKLSKADIPPGFMVAGPFSKEDRSINIFANPGIVTDKKLIATIYNKIDVNTINKVYAMAYVQGKHAEDALEVYIIQYKSKQMLDKEELKLPREKGCRYLEKDNYLFIIWSEEHGFPKQIDALAEHLQKRWSLTDISSKKQ